MGRTAGDVRLREIAYDPLPSQKKFHDSAARFKGFSGPIGSGKSQALCQEAVRLSYLNQGRMGLLGAPTYPMLRDTTQATLFEILDGNKIPFDHNKAENTLIMRDTRSKILFRPMDEFERLRGTNLAWFGLDELTYTQEEAWLRLEGRLRDPKAKRLCGFAAWTPKGYDWVYRRFLAKPVQGYEAVIAQPFENRHLLQRIPDYYDQLKDSYDDRFYRQEVMGLYARSPQPASVTLLHGSNRAIRILGADWSRITLTASGDAAAESIAFGVELPAGGSADLFGPQVEPQAGASVYKAATTGGVYENARFRDDVLSITTTGVNCHSATVNIIHANHL